MRKSPDGAAAAVTSPGTGGRRANSSGQNATARVHALGAGSDKTGASQQPRAYMWVAGVVTAPSSLPTRSSPVGTARKEPSSKRRV